jgi:predicted Rossmann fold nucleotide-binding protein DprA/Smf involved in DNA uptake
MEVTQIQKGDTLYPAQLSVCLGEDAPTALGYIGNVELLKSEPLALFCSKKCPGNLILKTYDLAQSLREAGTSVMSGFHSPVERECLNILLRGRNPIILCLARGLERIRIPKEYCKPMDEGRLLLLSPFSEKYRRADAKLATARNAVVAAIVDSVFVAHAEPGSKTEMLCRDVIKWGKYLRTFDDDANHHLMALGARLLVPVEAKQS